MLSRCVVSQVKHNSYFLVGVALGLWLALAAVPLDDPPELCAAPLAASAASDDYEPVREERPLGGGVLSGGGGGSRSVQRPRYYTTELGMRAPLLAGVLSSEDALETRVAALNRTAGRLQPALRFFMSAPSGERAGAHPPRANVVGFTDAREMLQPFHALKYLADNYLDDYDFFFLVEDTTYVNARRLTELVGGLSAAQRVHMGEPVAGAHYCSLAGGVLLSHGVLRALHAELEWCVRNSYSPHHHENLGRCVLHAAHLPCTNTLQGQRYETVQMAGGVESALGDALADAVSAHAVHEARDLYRLHALASRVHLQREHAAERQARRALARAAAHHPPHYRNDSWPPGLRNDPGLAPLTPESRFDHLRWTRFNATHVFMPDDHCAVAPLAGAHRRALQVVERAGAAWAARRWGGDVTVSGGAWRWEPAHALRYRLHVTVTLPTPDRAGARTRVEHTIEVGRVLGGARLVGVPYVTESARVTLVVGVPPAAAARVPAFLRRYEAACLAQPANTALILVLVHGAGGGSEGEGGWGGARAAFEAVSARHRGAALLLLDAQADGALPPQATDDEALAAAGRAALAAAAAHTPRDALILLAPPAVEFNEDFLNRVRMNTISGTSWFWPVPFARYAQYAHPRFLEPPPEGAAGPARRPATGTGRFNPRHRHVAAFYRRDYEAAARAWRGAPLAPAAALLAAHTPLRAHRAPDPGLVLPPPPPPCRLLAPAPADLTAECLRRTRDAGLPALELGARAALAKLLLELQAEGAPPPRAA